MSNTIFDIFFLFFAGLQGVKLGFSFCKCTHIAEDILHRPGSLRAILPNAAAVVGIGANRDDLTAQFFESAQVLQPRQKGTAGIHATGIELYSLPFRHQNPEDLIHHFPVIPIENGGFLRIGTALGQIGQVAQHIVIIVELYAPQRFFRASSPARADS